LKEDASHKSHQCVCMTILKYEDKFTNLNEDASQKSHQCVYDNTYTNIT